MPVLLVILLVACATPQSETIIEVERFPVVTVVTEEITVIKEVPVEVPVEVIVEVPVTPASCPPPSDIDWLIDSMIAARAGHQYWADLLSKRTLEPGSLLESAVKDQAAQLGFVAMYDRRLQIIRQLLQTCL